MKSSPLLTIGTFGTHLILNPAGSYSFVGEVPASISGNTYKTYDDGLAAFVDWFKGLSDSEKRDHVGNLRNDIFALCLNS